MTIIVLTVLVMMPLELFLSMEVDVLLECGLVIIQDIVIMLLLGG